ncbi:MAG TPA: hypothetical protein VEX68_14050 [Bryobacteraceae bacterium]|nr:hypothetical protein [Bryobacteraceae bacterium]
MTEEAITAIAREVLSPESQMMGKATLTAGRWTISFKHREFDLAQQVHVDDQPQDDAGKQRTRKQMAQRVGMAVASQRYD